MCLCIIHHADLYTTNGSLIIQYRIMEMCSPNSVVVTSSSVLLVWSIVVAIAIKLYMSMRPRYAGHMGKSRPRTLSRCHRAFVSRNSFCPFIAPYMIPIYIIQCVGMDYQASASFRTVCSVGWASQTSNKATSSHARGHVIPFLGGKPGQYH